VVHVDRTLHERKLTEVMLTSRQLIGNSRFSSSSNKGVKVKVWTLVICRPTSLFAHEEQQARKQTNNESNNKQTLTKQTGIYTS